MPKVGQMTAHAVPPGKTPCVACGGSKVASKGGECRPCRGLGYRPTPCGMCTGTSRTKNNEPCPGCYGSGVRDYVPPKKEPPQRVRPAKKPVDSAEDLFS